MGHSVILCVCLYVEPVSRSKDYVRSLINIGSVVLCLYTPVSPSVPEMEGIYASGGIFFWGCTLLCIYVFCIYSHARWSYRGRLRSLLLCPLSVERYYFPSFVNFGRVLRCCLHSCAWRQQSLLVHGSLCFCTAVCPHQAAVLCVRQSTCTCMTAYKILSVFSRSGGCTATSWWRVSICISLMTISLDQPPPTPRSVLTLLFCVKSFLTSTPET